jgi:hypothetical protein
MQSYPNQSLGENSLLTGKRTGNFSKLACPFETFTRIRSRIQRLAERFPTTWNREFVGTVQRIPETEQGIEFVIYQLARALGSANFSRLSRPADVGALATLMVRLSQFATDHVDVVSEIDINPVRCSS